MLERHEATKAAILDLLREKQTQAGSAIGMYEIGAPLVANGFEQDELLHALFALENDGTIELLEANGLRLLKPL